MAMIFRTSSQRPRHGLCRLPLRPLAVALLVSFGASPLCAQTSAVQKQEPVVVIGQTAPVLDRVNIDSTLTINQTLANTPQSINVFSEDLLKETSTRTLSQATRLDASLADSYNTLGYIESLQVRGFLLDNINNYRRNGLPVSNHAPLALENKAQIEVLKGVQGLHAGVSAPGGLVNLALKRPTSEPMRQLTLGVQDKGGSYAHADIGGRSGADGGFGYRINAALETLKPHTRNAEGERNFASVFFDFRLTPGTLLEVEAEYHRKQQPSVPGFGLLDADGDGIAESLHPVVDPRFNLNDQPWSQPFNSQSTVGSASLQHAFSPDWSLDLRHQRQRIRTDDRIAFPDGCSTGPNYVYPGLCGNYDVDLYDFRSENERRTLNATRAALSGRVLTGSITHRIKLALLHTRYRERFEPFQTYNFVGTTSVFAPQVFDAAPDALAPNRWRSDTSREWMASDVIEFSHRVSAYLGLRHTRIARASALVSDGSEAVTYTQRFDSPFAGVSLKPAPAWLLYATWGKGVESEAVPNRPATFANAGEVLPALQSKQAEAGVKWQLNSRTLVSLAVFDIRKPFADDVLQDSGLLLRTAGGKLAQHRGAEAQITGRVSEAWSLAASVALLDAKITRAVDPALVGTRVTNVPRVAATLFADYKVAAIPGLALNSQLSTQSDKSVVSRSQSVSIPSAWQWDAGIRYQQRWQGTQLTWRLNVENLLDRRYWKDAPTQPWGGIYLFAAQPRSLAASLSIDL
jgi:iron complex outermembrane receptor protein